MFRMATVTDMLSIETTAMLPNNTLVESTSLIVEPTVFNPWLGQFGTLQYFEISYMTILAIMGTFGNLVVIFSIALERRVHAHGNIFIINLAIADLLITGIVVPTVVANVIETGNALSVPVCKVVAFVVTMSCTASVCNLMWIALNRYWAVVKSGSYPRVFCRKNVYCMMAATWIWSCLLPFPATVGWGDLGYDEKIMVCCWDDEYSLSYTIFVIMGAIFSPLSVIAYCYYKLFMTVRSSGRWVRSLSVGSGVLQNNEQHRRSMRKEQSLLRTLATTVVFFCVCWLPYGFSVLFISKATPPHAKKVFGWVALSNSCVNFIIYGAMNPVFRRGYHSLFLLVFRCKKSRKMNSTMLHGSFSDSFRAARRITRSNENGNTPRPYHRSKSDPGKENSRVDTLMGVQRGIVETLRRASLITKPRSRMNTIDGNLTQEEKLARMKRNSAMLLQIQSSDEYSSGEDDELARNVEARFSRRAMSDIPIGTPKVGKSNGTAQSNGNCNACQEKLYAGYEIELMQSPLRGTWMPEGTVYRSRDHTPISGRTPQMKRSPSKNSSAVTSPVCEIEKVSNISKIFDMNLKKRRVKVQNGTNGNVVHPLEYEGGKRSDSPRVQCRRHSLLSSPTKVENRTDETLSTSPEGKILIVNNEIGD